MRGFLTGVTPQEAQVAFDEGVNLVLRGFRRVGEFGVVPVDTELLQNAEHGQQFGAFQRELEEGAQVQSLHAPGLAPNERNEVPGEEEDNQAEQEVGGGHGSLFSRVL